MFARGAGAPGSTDNDPIQLDADEGANVTAADFRSLLKVVDLERRDMSTMPTLEEWFSILKLAKKWDLISMRDKAISQLEAPIQEKAPIEKILLAKRYGVARWLREGYISLTSQEEAITEDEMESLGWETFGRLMQIREKDRPCNKKCGRCKKLKSNRAFDFESAIRSTFGDAVKD